MPPKCRRKHSTVRNKATSCSLITYLKENINQQEKINHELFNQYLVFKPWHYQYSRRIAEHKLSITNNTLRISDMKLRLAAIHSQISSTDQISVDDLTRQYEAIKKENETLCLKIDGFDQEKARLMAAEDAAVNLKFESEITALEQEQLAADTRLFNLQTLHQQLTETVIQKEEQLKTTKKETARTFQHLDALGLELKKLQDLDDRLGFLTLDFQTLSDELYYLTDASCRAAMHWRLGFIAKDTAKYERAIHHFYWAYHSHLPEYQHALEEIELIKSLIYTKAPEKKWLRLAQEALAAEDFDQSNMCALLALCFSEKEDHFACGSILINIYLQQKDWANADHIYQRMFTLEIFTEADRLFFELISTRTLTVLGALLQQYLRSSSPYDLFKALQITWMMRFQASSNSLSMYHDLMSNLITHYQTQCDTLDRSTQHLDVMSATLVGFYAKSGDIDAIKTVLDRIKGLPTDTHCPVLLGWMHYQYAQCCEDRNQLILAKKHYTYATHIQPSCFIEARSASQRLMLLSDSHRQAKKPGCTFFLPEPPVSTCMMISPTMRREDI